MKKFLTVLLVIAVMFTFSFGSAMAAVNPSTDTAEIVADRAAAVKKITDKYDTALATLNNAMAYAKVITAYPSTATAAEWNAAVEEAYAAVKAKLDVQLSQAYQELGNQEVAASAYAGGILGYYFGSETAPTPVDGYVYFKSALDKIDVTATAVKAATVTYVTTPVSIWNGSAFEISTGNDDGIDASKVMYDNALAAAIKAIEAFDVEKYSKEDKVTLGTTTKTSYEWAVEKRTDALALLGAFDDYGTSATSLTVLSEATFTKPAVEKVYKLNYEGTEAEAITGFFEDGYSGATYPALSALKTTQVTVSDAARIEYAKADALKTIKDTIEAKRAEDVKAKNEIIFAQSILSKPNQTIIDNAKEDIADLNELYDGMIEIWEARFANAEFRVEKVGTDTYVKAYYNDAPYVGLTTDVHNNIGFWNAAGVYNVVGKFNGGLTYAEVEGLLSEANVETTLNNIARLEKEAARAKAAVAVDGATRLEIDEALADAIADAYMFGDGTLVADWTDTVVHNHAHALLGYNCAGANIAGEVTVDGKKYDRLDDWSTAGYSANNTDAVEAIIEAAEEAIMAAATVEEADKAFVDAYAKYDAVLTTADQAALFYYGGALYKMDDAAKAELAAYIDYKVDLQDDDVADATKTAGAIKEYFHISAEAGLVDEDFEEDFLAEVVDAASLQAAVAEVKATVDSLMTKDELKAKGTELTNAINAVVRAVALTQEADILALYDDVQEYEAYCAMVHYDYPLTAPEALLDTDISRLEDLQLEALNDMLDALPALNKLTLADKDAVDAFYAAQEAYNEKYGDADDADNEYGAYMDGVTYTEADAYDAQIWTLQVENVQDMISALPVNASAEAVNAAKAALEELGFEGICGVGQALLTKLDKFEQDAAFDDIDAKAYLQDLAVKARSVKTAKGNVKVTVVADVDTLIENGYTVEYKFYRSTKSNKGFGKAKKVSEEATYTNTSGVKGTKYYYKAVVVAKDAEGNVVAQTPLKHCLYASRTWSK